MRYSKIVRELYLYSIQVLKQPNGCFSSQLTLLGSMLVLKPKLGKPSLKKKSVTFFTLRSDPIPPLFCGKCNENPKKKLKPF